MTEGQARPLVNVDPKVIEEVLPTILKEEWSARKIEQFIVQLKKVAQSSQKEKAEMAQVPYVEDTDRLIKRLAADVRVKTNAKGAGQIVIRFKSDADFQRINKLLDL